MFISLSDNFCLFSINSSLSQNSVSYPLIRRDVNCNHVFHPSIRICNPCVRSVPHGVFRLYSQRPHRLIGCQICFAFCFKNQSHQAGCSGPMHSLHDHIRMSQTSPASCLSSASYTQHHIPVHIPAPLQTISDETCNHVLH